jgi:selT/selW/selH-like putative selenoprotein
VKLIAGSGGVFEITIDGVLVYSKRSTGLFPDEEALLARLRGG